MRQHMGFWYLSHCQTMKAQTSLHNFTFTTAFTSQKYKDMDVVDYSEQNLDFYPPSPQIYLNTGKYDLAFM